MILYTVEIDGVVHYPHEFAPDRKLAISWSMQDGYRPCPVSVCQAGPLTVTIQHFAVRTSADDASLGLLPGKPRQPA